MAAKLQKSQDKTITLTITIPAAQITKAWDEVVDTAVKNATLPGFRKGMAPKKAVEDSLDKTHVQEDVLRKLLPLTYSEAIKEHNLKPIMSPKIHVTKLDSGKDWEYEAIVCETPEVKLNDYKDSVKKITAKSKIVVPGKPQEAPSMDEIVRAVLDHATITIPQVLIDSEVERLLSQLLDEVKSLGLTLDQYLASTHKTVEELRKDYQTRAENDMKFEFALQKIAEEEKITIEQKEIDEALSKAKDEAERKNLEANIYLLATILRQQKTLDFLKNL